MGTRLIILNIAVLLTACINIQAQGEKENKVEKIERFKYLYRYQDFYVGGQPSIKELRWLKSKGVNKIINLRSKEENSDYSDFAYNEKSIVEELGFEYYEIPVKGMEDYSPKKLDAVTSHLNGDGNILIHCNTGGRATQFFMAYLIKNEGYSINEAFEIGKKMRYSLPLELLLDIEIKLVKK